MKHQTPFVNVQLSRWFVFQPLMIAPGSVLSYGSIVFQANVILRATLSAAGPTLGKRALWWWLCCASLVAFLGLLHFRCFELLGFRVKCVGAGWLLEFHYLGIFIICLDTDIAFLVSETFHCADLVFPLSPLGDSLGDHGSSRKDTWGSRIR